MVFSLRYASGPSRGCGTQEHAVPALWWHAAQFPRRGCTLGTSRAGGLIVGGLPLYFFLRSGEVVLKVSKTDPFRKGVALVIGKGSRDLCPVAAVLDYMVRRGSGAGPLFQFSDGRFLTRARFVTAVRSALSQAGLAAHMYSGHSFRIGAATTAALCGMQDSLIKTLGRWQSSAYTVFVRTPREVL